MEGGPSIFSQGKGLLLQHGDVIESDWEYKDGRILPVKAVRFFRLCQERHGLISCLISMQLPLVKEKVFDDANR